MKSTEENLLFVSKNYQNLLQEKAKQINLTIAEWQLLRLIVKGYNTQRLLADNTDLDVSTLSRQLARLYAKNLVDKKVLKTDKEKLRSRPTSIYSLNEAGKHSLELMEKSFNELNQQIFEYWTDEEDSLLKILLNRLATRLQQIN